MDDVEEWEMHYPPGLGGDAGLEVDQRRRRRRHGCDES